MIELIDGYALSEKTLYTLSIREFVLAAKASNVTGASFQYKKGSILNIGVEEKKVEHKSPKSCRIESSNLIFTGGVYALQGLYNKNTGYGTHEG